MTSTGWKSGWTPTLTSNVTPNMLLQGYLQGVFPMSEGEGEPLFWVDPDLRGIFPIDAFHISRSLRRRLLRGDFEVRINHDFLGTMRACANRPETWINQEIYDLYMALHTAGFAQSVEVYQDNQMVGGVYGVTLGAAYFGESMFSTATDASKIALVYLMARLRVGGFKLFDTQFLTAHLQSLGAIEIPRTLFHAHLRAALEQPADFFALSETLQPSDVMHLVTQTS